jgi:dethiobiotin synthetase
MSYFVTGTDTGVGKTLVSCALLHAFAAQNKNVVGFKPVATGCDENDHNDDAKRLRAASNVQTTYGQVNPYCFVPPVAPHIAARQSGVRIELSRILVSYRELESLADEVIVEGAGGFLIPLNEIQDSTDLAKKLALPIIVVVGMRLGCINHALLTMRVIEDCGLQCAGWVANVIDQNMPALNENIESLRQRIEAPIIGVIPFQSEADASTVAGLLDIMQLMNERSRPVGGEAES